MLKVVFFGNSESVFSNRHFAALLDAPCDVAAVVDVPPSKRSSTNTAAQDAAPFVEIVRRRGIACFEPASANQPDYVSAIRDLGPDLFIAAGYMNILKPPLLAVPRIAAANFHASLLPDYRGKHPVFWALRNSERWSGLTVHAMDPGIDTGDIFYQVRVRTRKDDTVPALYDRIMVRSLRLVARLVEDAARRRIPRRPQPKSGGSYFSSVGEDDFRLDWSWDVEKVCRWITSTPGQCYCKAAGQQVYLTGAHVVARTTVATPGSLVRIRKTGCTIAVGAGAVRLQQGRLDDGNWLPMPELCRRLGIKSGDRLA